MELNTPDNFSLSTIFTHIPDAEKIVIFAHGLTVDKTDEGIFIRAEKGLHQAGISTLRFDFRGHGDSSGVPETDVTISGELTDLSTVVDFAKIQGFTQIGLAGASFGGSIAALYAGKFPQNIKALLLANPVIDYQTAFLKPLTPWGRRQFKNLNQRLDRDKVIKIGSRNFRLGKRLFDEMIAYSPGDSLSTYDGALAVVHGTNDSKIDFDSIQEIFLQLSNPQKIFTQIEQADHGFHVEPFETEVSDQVVHFFVRTLDTD